jgi:hypothetical protein
MTYKTILVHLNDSRRAEKVLEPPPSWPCASMLT